MKFDDYIRLIKEESEELERIPPLDFNSDPNSSSVKELESILEKWRKRHNALADEPLEL
jgi:ppGpp synthetase/RelA/SpoT-type nucleotidyltranferase